MRITVAAAIASLLLASVATAALPATLTFGQAASLSGLGARYQTGVLAAFAEINRAGGVHGATRLNLTSIDDGYRPSRTIDAVNALAADSNVVALLAFLGTPTSAVAIPIATANQLAFIAPYTGGDVVRTPYNRYVVNVRASYADEAAAWAHLLVSVHRFNRVACFYQNDSFGVAGRDGLARSLAALGRRLAGSGSYERGSADNLTEALESIAAAAVEAPLDAVVMVATGGPMATFVDSAKRDPRYASVQTFVAVSAGGDSFRTELYRLGGVANYEGVVMTQVMPMPSATSTSPLVRNYRAAIARYEADPSYDFGSLEGYLAGRLAIEIVKRLDPNAPVTRPAFAQAVVDAQYFRVDDLTLGLFAGECATVRQGMAGSALCECNQGMRKVWTTRINATTDDYEELPGSLFEFPMTGCQATPALLRPSLGFGLVRGDTAATSYDARLERGVAAAFAGVNGRGGAGGITLQLEAGDAATVAAAGGEQAWLTQRRLAALVGSGSTSSATVPVIGARGQPLAARGSPASQLTVVPTLEAQLAALVEAAVAAHGAGTPIAVVARGGDAGAARRRAEQAVETATGFGAALAAFAHVGETQQSSAVADAAASVAATAGARASVVLVSDTAGDAVAAMTLLASGASAETPLALFVSTLQHAAAPAALAQAANASAPSVALHVAVTPESLPSATGALADAFDAARDSDLAPLPAAQRSDQAVLQGYALGRLVELLVQQRANGTATGADLVAQALETSLLTVGPLHAGPFLDTESAWGDRADQCLERGAPGVPAGRCVCPHGGRTVVVARVDPATGALRTGTASGAHTWRGAACFPAYAERAPEHTAPFPWYAVVIPAVVAAAVAALAWRRVQAHLALARCPLDAARPFTVAFVSVANEDAVRARHGEAECAAAFARLARLVRAAARKHGCHEARRVDAVTVMLVAKRAEDAVRCGAAIVDAVAVEPWGAILASGADEGATQNARSLRRARRVGRQRTGTRGNHGDGTQTEHSCSSDHSDKSMRSVSTHKRHARGEKIQRASSFTGTSTTRLSRSSAPSRHHLVVPQVNVGVHTGFGAIDHDEETGALSYHGAVVTAAAHVADTGAGDHVVVSDPCAEAVADAAALGGSLQEYRRLTRSVGGGASVDFGLFTFVGENVAPAAEAALHRRAEAAAARVNSDDDLGGAGIVAALAQAESGFARRRVAFVVALVPALCDAAAAAAAPGAVADGGDASREVTAAIEEVADVAAAGRGHVASVSAGRVVITVNASGPQVSQADTRAATIAHRLATSELPALLGTTCGVASSRCLSGTAAGVAAVVGVGKELARMAQQAAVGVGVDALAVDTAYDDLQSTFRALTVDVVALPLGPQADAAVRVSRLQQLVEPHDSNAEGEWLYLVAGNGENANLSSSTDIAGAVAAIEARWSELVAGVKAPAGASPGAAVEGSTLLTSPRAETVSAIAAIADQKTPIGLAARVSAERLDATRAFDGIAAYASRRQLELAMCF